MLEEVVKEIKTAEEECRVMQSDAQEKARKILRDADAECDEIAKNAALEIKNLLNAERAAAEKLAKENYDESMKRSEKEAADLRNKKATEIDAVSAEIVKRIISKYGNR